MIEAENDIEVRPQRKSAKPGMQANKRGDVHT